MTQPRQLAEIRAQGVIQDLAPIDVPADVWTRTLNMVSRDQYQERIGGLTDVWGAPVAPPRWLLPVLTPNVSYWVYATLTGSTDGLAVTDGSTHNDITPVAGTDTNDRNNSWTGDILNGIPVMNPGNSEAQYWDLTPANPTLTLPGWEPNAKCGALRAHRDYLIAMDYTDGAGVPNPQRIAWSDSAGSGLPTEWIPTATNDAGDLNLSDTPGAIIDGLTLRQSFMVYKQGATHLLEFIGGQFIFRERLLFRTIGALSRNCVVEVPRTGLHCVLTDGDVIVHDGNTARSIIDQQNRRFLFDNINGNEFDASFVALNKARSEVWVCFPSGTSELPNLALVWDYDSDKWGIRELYETPHAQAGVLPDPGVGNITWDSQTDSWTSYVGNWNTTNFNPSEDGLVLADPDDGFYQVDAGSDAFGNPINAELVRESLDLGAPERVKMVRSIWPRIDGVNGDIIDIQVGTQMEQNEGISYSAAAPFVIGTDRKVDVTGVGRLISVRMASTGGQTWRCRGFDIEFGSSSRY